MGRPRKIHACAGCGRPTPRRGRATDGVRCLDCSLDRLADNVRQMRAGEGEFYDRWFAGMVGWMAREIEAHQDPDLVGEEPHAEY